MCVKIDIDTEDYMCYHSVINQTGTGALADFKMA